MEEDRLNLKASVSRFFGESEKALPFFNALYANNNFAAPPNIVENPESIANSVLFDMMVAKNYDGKPSSMNDNDIHNQFVDFIVNTALLHRQLDAPTSTNSTMSKMTKIFDDTVVELLNRNVGDKYFNLLCRELFDQMTDLERHNILLDDMLNSPYLTKIFTDLSMCNRSNNSGSLCWGTFWKFGADNSAVEVLTKLMEKVGVNDADDRFTVFLNTLSKSFSDALKQLFRNIYELIDFKTTSSDSEKQLKTIMQNPQLLQTFTKHVQNGARDAFKQITSALGVTKYTLVDANDIVCDFCENVLGKWDKLDGDAKAFFMEQIRIEKLTCASTVANRKFGVENLLKNPTYMSKLDCDKKNIRINLLKAEKGSDMTMFAHTLPFVPVKNVGKLWYTNANNVRTSVPNEYLTPSILKDIYQCVYLNDKQTPAVLKLDSGKTQMTFKYEFADSDKPFDHDLTTTFKTMINNIANDTGAVQSSNDVIQDLETQISWQNGKDGLYRIDGKGEKILHSEYTKQQTCSSVLGLNGKNRTSECTQIAKCILYSPEKLEECIGKYHSDDLFDVAYSDMRNLDPQSALRLLQVFHVGKTTASIIDKNRNNADIYVPMTFSHWKENVLNNKNHMPNGWTETFKNTLRKSEKLQKYISGIISFVSANPAIMNRNIVTDTNNTNEIDRQTAMLNNTKEASQYSIRQYVSPYKLDGENTLAYRIADAHNNATANAFAVVPSSFALPAELHAFMGEGVMQRFGSLNSMGGGAYMEGDSLGSSSVKRTTEMLRQNLTELAQEGLKFSAPQEKEILKFLTEAEKSDRKIKDMIKVTSQLKNIQNLAKKYDNGKYHEQISGKVLNLVEIGNQRELLNWLDHNIRDYDASIYDGMKYINSGTTQILKSFNDLIQRTAYNGKKSYTSV